MKIRTRLLQKSVFSFALIGLGAICLMALVYLQSTTRVQAGQTAQADWRADWAVSEGFALEIDSQGYQFPTAIAFVPNPGSAPGDPLYFVTELGGQVKVVTNDRTVHTFAEGFFTRKPAEELPEVEGETGLAGICLAPEQGYVFVTYAYMDDGGILRNGLVRFESQPETFSIQPAGQTSLEAIFSAYESAVSHQIGSCQVAGERLFISVGDGRQTDQSQEVNSLLGKVLRMTLDGQPAPENPFFQAGEGQTAAPYVWAYGFRNPFGLKTVGEQVFVADNGSDIDRFLEVQRGENYLWDGSDWSIGARAGAALSPDIGPVQVEYYPGGLAELPEPFERSFFIAASRPELAGILRIGYNLEDHRVDGVPQHFLRYRGSGFQIVSGVALGPDGLYFAPTMPDAEGQSAILKAVHRPAKEHPYLMLNETDPEALMWEKGCFGCHQLNSEGGTAGPTLDRREMVDRLNTKLNSEEYLQTLTQVDRLDREPFTAFKQARQEVLQAQGEERLRIWMTYHILEPRFDNPYSQMPNTGLTKTEAQLITQYLLEEKSFTERLKDQLLPFFPAVILPRHLLFAFVLGALGGAVIMGGAFFLKRLLSRRNRQPGASNR